MMLPRAARRTVQEVLVVKCFRSINVLLNFPRVSVEMSGSPVKNNKYDFVAFDSDEEGEGEASVLTIPNLLPAEGIHNPTGNATVVVNTSDRV